MKCLDETELIPPKHTFDFTAYGCLILSSRYYHYTSRVSCTIDFSKRLAETDVYLYHLVFRKRTYGGSIIVVIQIVTT